MSVPLPQGRGTVTEEPYREKWDRRYRHTDRVPEPARVLNDNLHLLPASGRALDLACGLGANALALAHCGLDTVAWDLSPVAIETLLRRAAEKQLTLSAAAIDVVASPPVPESFDVIVVAHFLERALAGSLVPALRPGGLLFYQTFTRSRVNDTGPGNPAYRLADNELLSLFVPPMRLRVYREEGTLGNTNVGFRNLAMMVAERI